MPTDREREVLTWTARGKTSWEIGQIMGISPRTVEYHLTKAKAKLKAANLCHAVAEAMKKDMLAPSMISIGLGMKRPAIQDLIMRLFSDLT